MLSLIFLAVIAIHVAPVLYVRWLYQQDARREALHTFVAGEGW